MLAPANTVAPVVTGNAYVGQTLSCTTGTWSGIPTPTFTYQWKRDGADIGGATSSTYEQVLADAGTDVTCTVTATNAVGAASANSNAIETYHPILETAIAAYEFWAAYVTNGTGSAIASVIDLSGNGNTISAVHASNRPTNGADAAYNNKTIAAFTATPGLKRATYTQGAQSQPLTIITVGEETANAQAMLYDGGAGNFTGPYRYWNGVADPKWLVGAGGTEINGSTVRTKAARLDQFEVDATGTDRIFSDDWTNAVASGDSGGNTMNGISVGDHGVLADFTGKLAFIGVFGALDVNAKTRIAAYLNATYSTSITLP